MEDTIASAEAELRACLHRSTTTVTRRNGVTTTIVRVNPDYPGAIRALSKIERIQEGQGAKP